MGVTGFISGKLRFRGRAATVSIALSFLVMIIAVSVSSGFRKEIRDALSEATGDVRLVPVTLDWLSGTAPIERSPAYLPYLDSVAGIRSISPVAYRAGIVKNGDVVHGVMFKGTEDFAPADSVSLPVSIPSRLAAILSVSQGDSFQTYFVGERVKARKFTVVSVYDDITGTDDRLVVYAKLSDIQRVNDWDETSVSAFEIILDDAFRTEAGMAEKSREIGAVALLHSSDDEASVVSVSSAHENPQLFDWLSLIDFNAVVILVLMTLVAGFNMISGLLILLFENISTIGILKSLGMTDRSIAKVFLRRSSVIVLKGMLAGNVIAIALCLVQSHTHAIALDPANYFISFVPVRMDLMKIMAADAAAYLLIMLLLLLPSMFISKVDPARTVRMS